MSNTKTKYSVGSVVTMSGTEGDVATINSLIGAIYQIDDKSNLSLSVGTSSSGKNRDTSDENDTNTFLQIIINLQKKYILFHILLQTQILEEQLY